MGAGGARGCVLGRWEGGAWSRGWSGSQRTRYSMDLVDQHYLIVTISDAHADHADGRHLEIRSPPDNRMTSRSFRYRQNRGLFPSPDREIKRIEVQPVPPATVNDCCEATPS